MKRLTMKLLALCMALAILGGIAAVSEPVVLEGASLDIDPPESEAIGPDLPDITLEDVAPASGESSAASDGAVAPNDAVESGVCGADVRWTLDSDGLLTISGSGDMDNTTYFFSHPGIRRVVVEAGVTSIGTSAFNGCSELESVSLPEGLRNIWAYAFQGCLSLTRIDIPYGVPFISGYAFARCFRLSEITLPESVTEVVDHAFDECPSLTIRGYDNSFAEVYARANAIPFVSLGPAPARTPLPEPTATPAPTPAPTPTEAPRTSLSGCKIAVKPQVYSGRAKTPAVKVTLDGQTLSRGADYTVEYSDNVAIGRAAVTVTGVGRYTGVATASFRINPKAVAGLKLTPGKGLINASWKKAPGGVTGYQLQYALKQSFRGAKQASVPKAATVKKALKGLKKGKTYFVRIRAYKKAGKATYYSAWSPAKKAKVK